MLRCVGSCVGAMVVWLWVFAAGFWLCGFCSTASCCIVCMSRLGCHRVCVVFSGSVHLLDMLSGGVYTGYVVYAVVCGFAI